MRVLQITQVYDPEPAFKGAALSRGLRDLGHEVEVLTTFPNYPGGRVYPGYKIQPWQRDEFAGFPVLRVPVYPSHDTSAIRRIASYSTFAAAAALLGPLLIRKADVAYVYSSPATAGLPAAAMRLLRGVPFVFDIQDLWPDSVADTGMLSNPYAMRVIDWLCRGAYRLAARIVVPAPGLRDLLIARGVPPTKVEVVYNWADEHALATPIDGMVGEQFGMTGRFNVVFAGTMGRAQGLDCVVEAARLVWSQMPRVQFLLVGGGVEVPQLQAKVRDLRLENVRFVGRMPTDAIGSVLAAADVLLVHLRSTPLFHRMIPSKTQAYMAVGKPILMAVEGDASTLVERAGAGRCCRSDDPKALADTVLALARLERRELDAMGRSGRDFYQNHLTFAHGMSALERILKSSTGANALDG